MSSLALRTPNLLLRDLWSASVDVLGAWEQWQNGEIAVDIFAEAIQKLDVAAAACERREPGGGHDKHTSGNG
jgi:hypothetical protein